MMKAVYPLAFLATVAFSTPALAEQLRYSFSGATSGSGGCLYGFKGDGEPSEAYEKKRRAMIEEFNLSRDLQWYQGQMLNEWGDNKEAFCYLVSNGKAYIYRPSAYIIFGKTEVRPLTN